MNLYHCTATGPFGPLGDYVLGRSRAEAERKFYADHGLWPHTTRIERRKK